MQPSVFHEFLIVDRLGLLLFTCLFVCFFSFFSAMFYQIEKLALHFNLL